MTQTHDIPDAFEQEIELYNWRGSMAPADIARRLRSIAGQLERGTVTLENSTLTIPATVAMKLELEEDHTGDMGAASFGIEIELIWPVRPISA